VERLLGKLFGHPFFKVLSLTHLTLLLLDFEITKTILLAKRRNARQREECVREEFSQDHESIHINGRIRTSNEYL
jgi:hypothetical protein